MRSEAPNARSPEAKPLAGYYACRQTGVILQGKTLIEASAHKVSPKDVLVDILCSGDPLRTSEKVQGNEKPSVCRGKVGDAPGGG